MSTKESTSLAAAERIRAAALSASKGLSRAQAERAATAAARNVNAYGQKEEGPSRWQERKEAKRMMYLSSTEQAVKLGIRSQKGVASNPGNQMCQKCYKTGHWTYECKNERVYVARPSRSQQLKNPKLRTRHMDASELLQDDSKGTRAAKESKKESKRSRKKSKRKDSDSDSESDTSNSDSGSDSGSESDSESGSDSESKSGSDSLSESESDSGSESGSGTESESSDDDRRRKDKKRKTRRH